MRRRFASVVLVTLLLPSISTPARALDEMPSARPDASASPAPPAVDEAISFTLGPPRDRSVGGWREIARASYVEGLFRHLSVVGGRLVAHATVCDMESCRDVSYHSVDGISWTEATFPGRRVAITDMAVTPDGSMAIAVGATSHRGSGESGAVWSSRDGREWTQTPAPPVREVERIAASDDAILVSSGDGLWVSQDLGSWRPVKVPGDLEVAFGPGGFIAFGGGGQDVMSASRMWHSQDGLKWRKVKLPKTLREGSAAFGGIQVFSLDDRWILVPDDAKLPKAIFVSRDGRDWRRVPRPRWMEEGYVWWIDDLGQDVQAFGWAPDLRKQPNGMWTWEPGKKVGKPVLWHQDRIGRPVSWGDQRIALGESSDNQRGVTLWRWEPTAEEP